MIVIPWNFLWCFLLILAATNPISEKQSTIPGYNFRIYFYTKKLMEWFLAIWMMWLPTLDQFRESTSMEPFCDRIVKPFLWWNIICWDTIERFMQTSGRKFGEVFFLVFSFDLPNSTLTNKESTIPGHNYYFIIYSKKLREFSFLIVFNDDDGVVNVPWSDPEATLWSIALQADVVMSWSYNSPIYSVALRINGVFSRGFPPTIVLCT